MDNLTVAMTREYVELLEILKNLPDEEFNKIPREEIEYYERKKDLTYNFNIDPSIELAKQNISRGAYALFVNLYQKYIASPEEQKLVEDILNLNERKKADIIKQESIVDTMDEKTEIEQDITIVPIKESFFKKCLNKIKHFFGFGEVD